MSDCDDCVTNVTLPWAFPWIDGGTTTTRIGVSDNGSGSTNGAFISFLDIELWPFDDLNPPRISAAHADLDPSFNGTAFNGTLSAGIFAGPMGDSFIISWEGVEDWFREGFYIFAQIQLFEDGRINLCWEDGFLGPFGDAFLPMAAGFEDDEAHLYFPVQNENLYTAGTPNPLDPGFDEWGLTWEFPLNRCACYVPDACDPMTGCGK